MWICVSFVKQSTSSSISTDKRIDSSASVIHHSLMVREGLTSEGNLSYHIQPSSENLAIQQEVLVSSQGFYVRLKGAYNSDTAFVMAYTAFTTSTLSK